MSAEAFGAELKRHRSMRRLSRAELARRAGLSESGIKNLEDGVRGPGPRRWSEPRRETVVDLAAALGWEPDDALAVLGREPLAETERLALARPPDLRDLLDKLWPSLTDRQRQALVQLAAAMADPHGQPSEQGRDVVVYRVTATTGR